MRILVLFLVFFLPYLAKSQHNHFIYIQGDNQQNFYIRKGGELLSSSSSGFIILPKLAPGTHQFIIGFPKEQWPEYEFSIEVKDKDRGFTLKNFQDKGWGLFDMQSMDIIMGRRIEVKKQEKPQVFEMTEDPFSVILASVVDDPRIRETSLISSAAMVSAPVVKPTEKQDKSSLARSDNPPTTTAAKPAGTVSKADEQKIVKLALPEPDPAADQKTIANVSKPPVEDKKAGDPGVQATSSAKVSGETGLVMPVEKKETKTEVLKEKDQPPVVETKAKEIQGMVTEPADTKERYAAQKVRKISELKTWSGYSITYVDMTGSTPDTISVSIDDTSGVSSAGAGEVNEVAAGELKAKAPRTDCRNMAREKDVLAVRKKMLMLTDDAAMVGVVVKEVKTRCFTTEQLQNLSYVFVSDKGRYQLFEEVYPYVFDPANYQRLERLFNGEEYVSRFRALIKSN